jgi:hypothetical protein
MRRLIMVNYIGLENDAHTKLSENSWVKIAPDGFGTLYSNENKYCLHSLEIPINIEDLLPLGRSLLIALGGQRNSFVVENGKTVECALSATGGGVFISIDVVIDNFLSSNSIQVFLDFCIDVLMKASILPANSTRSTVFPKNQIDALIKHYAKSYEH